MRLVRGCSRLTNQQRRLFRRCRDKRSGCRAGVFLSRAQGPSGPLQRKRMGKKRDRKTAVMGQPCVRPSVQHTRWTEWTAYLLLSEDVVHPHQPLP